MDALFIENIKKSKVIEFGDTIVVGLSGGADSMYLMYNLLDLKDDYNLNIIACHLNHGIRENAIRDEIFVRNFCSNNEVELFVERANMNEYAKKNGLSKEEAGRILRYDFFRRVADGKKIATAHNRDDQVETILFRILRGTSSFGLRAMSIQNMDLIKPILNISRSQIEDYLHKNKLDFIEDETNFTKAYMRNKIRLELLPYLRSEFPYDIDSSILRLGKASREEWEFLDEYIGQYKHIYLAEVLDTDLIKDLQTFVKKAILKRFIDNKFRDLEISSFGNLNRVLELIDRKKNCSIDLGKNISARYSYGKLFIERPAIKIDIEEIRLNIGLNNTPLGDYTLELSNYSIEDNKVSIDYDKLKGDIYLRTRRNGDRFSPLGLNGTKKLKDYFIDKKIDRIKRDEIPLICDQDGIIWVVGFDISQRVKVDNKTKNILTMEAKLG